MGDFWRDTAVKKIGENHWRGHLCEGWRIGEVPNGGYVMALGARALSEALAHPHPQVVNAFYISPTELGPIDCFVTVLRSSKRTSHASVQMIQKGEPKVILTAAYVDLNVSKGPNWSSFQADKIPVWDDCEIGANSGLEFRQRVDIRLASGGNVFRTGKPSGEGKIEGWLAHQDRTDPDVISLLMFADAMPPPAFNVFGKVGWVPTVELTVQIRALPSRGPIQARMQTSSITSGVMEEDGTFWDTEGQLVAIGRQTARIRLKQ
ncbi:MAG: thioesterase family protein [Halieaceae bacterium]|nr:thioesterase family protein [Halieaceae bacterium]